MLRKFLTLGPLLPPLLVQLATSCSSVYGQDLQTPLGLHAGSLRDATSSKRLITPELSAFIEGLRESAQIPGVTLGVVQLQDGQTPRVELNAWGRQTEEGDGKDLTPDALFDIASCSKAILAASVGILIDDFAHGRNVTPLPPNVPRFDWDTKIHALLPDDWALADEWASSKANLRDVLSHVSGMPRHDFSYGPGDSPRSVTRKLRDLQPAYELRQKWSYNNMMYKMASYLVATYANTSYTAFVSSRLFEPLNMTSSTFWPDKAAAHGKLTQSWTRLGRRVPFWFTNDVVELVAGAGGVISSVEDLTKWVTVLLSKGVDPDTNKTIVPRSAYDEMTTAHAIVSGVATEPDVSIMGYGLGWQRWSYQGHETISHTGAIPGFSTRVAFLPSDGLGLVVLANADEKAAANEAIMYRIAEDVLGLRRIDRPVGIDPTGQAVYLVGDYQPVEQSAAEIKSPQPLALDIDDYAGTYVSPGYGAFTLCAPSSDSQYCTSVLADFSPFRPEGRCQSQINSYSINVTDSDSGSASPSLYAAWPRIWSTHLRMVHSDGETFTLEPTALFPHGYGADKTAFETFETVTSEARAVFVVDESAGARKVRGFGVMIDEDAVSDRKRRAERVEEIADAWFERVY
ncbi:beta-lactamase/transpeptidase-like protein [Wolfiporia cocos MD-104 SS10]|uniref:Beta-lactamase/transpeptidase-like protein n=1 Tax=Wolfiporia cocos (strain MD-104) TaxID=742152 RepID=A0A2H3JKZ3_WOLCO|nr:beta-lactamase/transpeptidase-like protein [Wolfiporia cocos MD-104 SS10]